MKFNETLSNYIKQLNISAKELSDKSTLSPTLISRYLNGKRTPSLNSEYFNKIVDALYAISYQKKINYSKEDIKKSFEQSIIGDEIDFNVFSSNFNTLILELKINLSDLAKYTSYDTSFLSKIKSKNRKPSDLKEFCKKVSEYIVNKYFEISKKEHIANVISCNAEELENDKEYYQKIFNFLITSHSENNRLIENFLKSLDTYNLSNYTSGKFNNIKVPTSPIILKNTKTYLGSLGRKNAESDFLKTTILSKSTDPIFFFSNLPITDAAKDENFKESWIKAITMILKKENHLNIIHDITRPLNEMLIGLENWIPIYMSGTITPYYFKDFDYTDCYTCIAVSGAAAMYGECNKSYKSNILYYVTTKSKEIDYYKEKSKYLLSIAKPLMKIYKHDNENDFNDFLKLEENQNYEILNKDIFKNINFYVKKNKWVIINKNTEPKIHFVVFNEKLRSAIETFLNT